MAAPNGSANGSANHELPMVDIRPLLSRLWPVPKEDINKVSADDIADAIAHFFTNRVSDVQAASLLMCLHFTGLDRRAEVMAAAASRMRSAAERIDMSEIRRILLDRNLATGDYQGGLVDIVGTGGDAYNTFNISTTSSIIASSLLMVAKHGNRASTSKSGSADLLANMRPAAPAMDNVAPDTLAKVYAETNYAFLFAPVFHTGMRYVAPIRKQLPWRTLFNLLGPLSNPIDSGVGSPAIEARVIGVARTELGPVFLDALRMAGADKAMVVCGFEELDEVSCAGPTNVWRLRRRRDGEGNGPAVVTEHFVIRPADFGLPEHPLSAVSGNKEPAQNAEILYNILHGRLDPEDPILDFVLLNTATLLVASGICEADESDMGHGDDGVVIKERGPGGARWKEGVRRARWALQSGEAWRQWEAFVKVTNSLNV